MLNRLERLTQRVGGSNELVDQWLQARKQLLVAYCTLVGLKPNKEKHTPLNEKRWRTFATTWWITSPQGIFISMTELSNKWKARPVRKCRWR